jgi:hypothetical protein
MAPEELKVLPPTTASETVDLSLLPVPALPADVWKAKSLFRTTDEVAAQLPRPKGAQVLPFVLFHGEVWTFRDLGERRGPFRQTVDPMTAECLDPERLLGSDNRNVYL